MSAKLTEILNARFGAAGEIPGAPEAWETLAGRGACRAYADRPVDPRLVRGLCAAALSAPSKSDLQLRDIVIVTDPEIRARLDGIAGFDWLPGAPVLLVFLANLSRLDAVHARADVPTANEHFDAAFNAFGDAAVALGYAVAAAEMAGLGTCPISVLRNDPDAVAETLRLPPRVAPFAGLAVGWPAVEAAVQPRLSLPATVHENRFSDETDFSIPEYDARRGWNGRARGVETWGLPQTYGWSDDKARQYARPQRMGWGAWLRARGFPFG